MMKDNYYFSTEELAVGYGGKALISNINIGIKKGEILTLIGPNGSGKSTILKSITKHLGSIAGVVYIDRKDMHTMSGKETASRLSVVLTEKISPDMMTCGEVVATGRYPYTNHFGLLTENDRIKVMESLEKVHALELYDRDFLQISDGQRQRIMLARAICQEPEIIVLDEPTSYLDIKHKMALLDILMEMAREQKITVIMSLHEIDLAYKISDKIMCVKGESVEYFGSPEQIFTEKLIQELYDIQEGTYDILFGSVELARPEGQPDILVIGGNGSGIPFYRMLQRNKVTFVAGVLYENDMDYRIASALASQVISAKAYQPINESVSDSAFAVLENVSAVADCGCIHGDFDKVNVQLLEEARKSGKKIISSLKELEMFINIT